MTERQDRANDLVAKALAAPDVPPLKPGVRYSMSKGAPLMPQFVSPRSVRNIDEIVAQIKYLPPNTWFVVERMKLKRDVPWYYCEAFGLDGVSVGYGWINSISLIGQQIEEVPDVERD